MIEDHGENTALSGEGGASFGFREVSPKEKTALVRGVFDSVASRYDVMNDAMSGGVHRLWKSAMIDWLHPRPGMRLLDVAGGTGDIAFRILDSANRDVPGGRTPAAVTVCDINEAMLNVGRDRAVNAGRLDNLDWMAGNAEALPFADASYDAYTIAFGIRNVTDIPAALREARRVLKPGGRFLCLEFSNVEVPLLKQGYDFYSLNVVPHMGRLIAGDAESYRYLVESIRRFPDRETFAAMIDEAGLSRVSARAMSGGIVALHSAWRV
ncbi:bifunctional demethylmenaquinone methyltransferase/2-methoxy-6-polyprenyl-1,4-benzoquinol methylase UbiE [Emcibacter sp. SYSU 3D8]|uniref:bifunctional demethylmenaquinone methyltransferase/2-methoxy-6-polyprenyl-1,4-benzoquinol methylase UbiE n=1 Tax=Emcibacter sp. SYSU 3D8 TaxID=3133969 RepID=UPI0031FEA1C9